MTGHFWCGDAEFSPEGIGSAQRGKSPKGPAGRLSKERIEALVKGQEGYKGVVGARGGRGRPFAGGYSVGRFTYANDL